MIRSTINYINDQIETLGIFTNLHGLTKLWTSGDQIFPVVYSGGGDSGAVNFDYSVASLYHRLTGEINITQSEDEFTGCDILITETYPMRLVCYFKNSALGLDDEYSSLRVAANIKNLLPSDDISTVANTFKLSRIEVQVDSIQTDSFEVWGDEFSTEFKVPSDHSLISIDYNIILIGSQSCFEAYACA